jgi:nitrogen regulatory protein PII
MKMLIVVYNDAIDETILSAFKEAEVKGYTKWKETLGEGNETEPKLGTHYWPGRNNVLAVVMEDEKVPVVTNIIKELKTKHPKSGIKTFILQVEETI